MTKPKQWSDEDLGVIYDTLDRPAREVSLKLDRPVTHIYAMRTKLKRGNTNTRQLWTEEEDAYLVATLDTLTAEQAARNLPGRTPIAINGRRAALGAPSRANWQGRNPWASKGRKILARTCLKCGLLLPGEKFYTQRGKRSGEVIGACAYCSSDSATAFNKGAANKAARDERRRRQTRDWKAKIQAATELTASRRGMPYLEADFEVLADPTLTILGKALRLHRTYDAIVSACFKKDYPSFGGRTSGSRTEAAWSIDNPNADRVDEITAALKQEFTDAGVQFPEWDWDDEDLKETAA